MTLHTTRRETTTLWTIRLDAEIAFRVEFALWEQKFGATRARHRRQAFFAMSSEMQDARRYLRLSSGRGGRSKTHIAGWRARKDLLEGLLLGWLRNGGRVGAPGDVIAVPNTRDVRWDIRVNVPIAVAVEQKLINPSDKKPRYGARKILIETLLVDWLNTTHACSIDEIQAYLEATKPPPPPPDSRSEEEKERAHYEAVKLLAKSNSDLSEWATEEWERLAEDEEKRAFEQQGIPPEHWELARHARRAETQAQAARKTADDLASRLKRR